MSQTTTSDTCRLTVVAPAGWAEVALPIHVPLADLVPVLVRNADPNLADAGVQHNGWVLQRLGEAPLDEDRTLSGLGLVDGETVYLRPRDAAIPANVRGHSLQRHDGYGARVLGDLRLLSVDDVHDDAALEHLRQPALDTHAARGRFLAVLFAHLRAPTPRKPRHGIIVERHWNRAIVLLQREGSIMLAGRRG